MFCVVPKPYLLILANLQINKRQKKETLRFSHRFFAYMHLSKREIFHSYKKYRKFFIFFTFLHQSSCIKSKKMQVYLVKRPPRAIIVLLKSVRWHVARLSGALVDRLLTQKRYYINSNKNSDVTAERNRSPAML